jgi:hypothetical protein
MKKLITLSVAFFMIFTLSHAQIIETVKFDETVSYSKSDEYDMIRVKGADLTAVPGNPQLPVITKHFLIPQDAAITGIEVLNQIEEEVSGDFEIFPVQKPSILNTPVYDIPPEPWTNKNIQIYESEGPYPENTIEIGSQGSLTGYNIVSIRFYPFQYYPLKKKVRIVREITFRINYKTVKRSTTFKRISHTSRTVLKKHVSSLCENYEEKYDPFRDLDSDSTIDYVIITTSSFESYFQPLCDWKTQKGIHAKIVTLDSIYANYSGVDNQEKIRNFIKDAHANWGTIWVLLGGDTDIVPARIAYAMTCEAGMQNDEDSIRADLYYSDLDGSWNENGISPFGEVADSVDLYPDVFVGRAPVSSPPQVISFVNKIITYETSPPMDYELKVLFFAMILWPDPYTDGGKAKDMIDSLYVPERFTITKLYESWGNLNFNTVVTAINSGQNLLNHNGHAWHYVMSVGPDHLWNSDMDNLTNGNRQGILYSIGCWAAAIDYDCIAEHYVNNPNGGGVAFIGNSRYGWGSPGNPCFGYSDRFDQKFYEVLMVNGIRNIGLSLAMDKAHFVSRARQENVYRWHQYQLNLLGDPEMPIWTDTPAQLLVYYPDTLQNGMEVTVTVRDENGIPKRDALVCLMNDSLYERGYTNKLGEYKTTLAISSPGTVTLTATADDYLPYIDTLYAKINGPYFSYDNHIIQDNITGNNDGLLNPGEDSYLFVEMRNSGTQSVSNPAISLTSIDTFITILDGSHAYIGSVDPESTVLCTFSLSVSSNCENGDAAIFSLSTTSPEGTWLSHTNEIIAKPVLFISCDTILDENNNGIPEPGESIDLCYSLMNYGYGFGYNVSCLFSENSSYFSITNGGSPSWTTIHPESCEVGTLSLDISPACPDPYFSPLDYTINTTEGYTFPGSLLVAIGNFGFADDMESGTSKWNHAGSPDNWHLSSYRKHSGTYSWYCGLDGSHTYVSSSNDSLMSVPFTIGPNTHLTFWHWYEFTNYGSDGLYVIIRRQSSYDTLDFIGSGGALDSILPIWNDWFMEDYNLSYIPVGEQIQLYLSFFTDSTDTAEGIYVDDVNIEGDWVTGKEEVGIYTPVSINHLSVYPSIMSSFTNVIFSTSNPGNISISVYDITGRRVKSLFKGRTEKGERLIRWDGTNEQGGKLSHGIYFVRMDVPGSHYSTVKKIVLIR